MDDALTRHVLLKQDFFLSQRSVIKDKLEPGQQLPLLFHNHLSHEFILPSFVVCICCLNFLRASPTVIIFFCIRHHNFMRKAHISQVPLDCAHVSWIQKSFCPPVVSEFWASADVFLRFLPSSGHVLKGQTLGVCGCLKWKQSVLL